MSNHTPGPWTWWTSNSWRRLRHDHRGHSTNVLMPTVHRDGCPDIEVSQEDMALIAAAPEILAALYRCIEVIEFAYMNAPEQPKELREARATIAKAEGRSP